MKRFVAFITLVFFLLGAGMFLPAVQADTKSPLAGKMFADKTDKKEKKDKIKKIFKGKKGTQDPCADPKNAGKGPCGPPGPGGGAAGPGGPTGPGPGGQGPGAAAVN